jgi:hypothetical protein
MTEMGHRCGYVGVPEGHSAYGANYEDVRTINGEYIDVHGGLTFADKGSPGWPSAKENNFFWLGFDCAHVGDAPDLNWLRLNNPKMFSIRQDFHGLFRSDETVKTLDYCIAECEKLAAQLNPNYIQRKRQINFENN